MILNQGDQFSQANVFIITGPKGSGKTKLAMELARLLMLKNKTTNGFLSIANRIDNKSISYTLHCLSGNYTELLAQKNEEKNWLKLGGFYFNPYVIDAAYDCIFNPEIKAPSLYIIDEIGKLDIEGHIWHNMFTELTLQARVPVVITARDIFVEIIVDYWQLENIHTFDAGKTAAGEIYNIIFPLA